MKSSNIAEYVKLSVPERIQLVEDIWDSIAEIPEELPITEAQQAELDRRLDAYHLNPEEGSPGEICKRKDPEKGSRKLPEKRWRWTMNELITVNPNICAGKPVIRGTRIMVKNILGLIAGGYTLDQVLQTYPELTREMVDAALQYAVIVVDEEKMLANACAGPSLDSLR